MNWIKKLVRCFINEKQHEKETWDDLRRRFCKYSENPFSTDMRNYMQRIKITDSPTGWGVITLSPDEVKKRLDSGICWIDYPALNEDGTEIKGITGINFH